MNKVIVTSPEELKALIAEVLRDFSPGSGSTPDHSTEDQILTREQLCKRLLLSDVTVRRWEKKGRIPAMRIGGNVRYNLRKVLQALEQKKGGKPQ